METQLLIKIVHMSAVSLACVVILARAMTLFKGVQGNQPNPAGRTAFVALQHLSMLVIVLTGIALLVMKNFDVQTWFYAKVVLFLVMLSALSRAYKKEDSILLTQRRAGLFLAVVAMISILGLVMIKPNFGYLLDIIIGTAIVLRYTAIYSGKITRGRGFHAYTCGI